MPKIKAVALDVDGTLVTLRTGIGELYAEALRGCRINLSPGLLQDAVLSTWRNFESDYLNVRGDFATNAAREILVWHEFVRRVLEDCQIGLGSREDLIAALYSYFASGVSRRVAPGALELCSSLRQSGLRVVAASNNDLRTGRVLAELGFSDSISSVLTAGELGWKKPSPRFFAALAVRLDLPPEQILHVGNSARLDVEAAQRAGMQAVLLDPERAVGRGTIKELREIPGLLGLPVQGPPG